MKKICIVGAGPAGLIAAQNLCFEPHFEVTIFEKNSTAGGVWQIDSSAGTAFDLMIDVRSPNFPIESQPMYNAVHSKLAASVMQLHGVPWQYSCSHPHQSEVALYLETFARLHLPPVIQYNTRVLSIALLNEDASSPEAPRWLITIQQNSNRLEHRFDAVVLATGHNSRPRIPSVFRSPPAALFAGSVTHACQYRSPQPFAGQRVLVVGGGFSGAEISAAVARVAAACHWSLGLFCSLPLFYITFPCPHILSNRFFFQGVTMIRFATRVCMRACGVVGFGLD